jgi:DNA-binding MarR family transcriptional regulator
MAQVTLEQLMDQINWFIRMNRPKPKDSNLRPSEMMVLMVLGHHRLTGGNSVVPSELSKELNLSRPALTPILNELETKGFIRREFDDKDRRRTKIVMEEAKFHEIKAGFGNYSERFQYMIDRFEPDELNTLYRLLSKANLILNDYNKENADEKSI